MINAYSRPTLGQLSLPLTLTLAALLLALLPESKPLLDWSRTDLAAGQWWRLFSGHLLHSNSAHLWMNLGGLWLLFGLHQPHYQPKRIWPISLLMMLFISAGIYWGVTDTWRYVGLSALLHGLFTFGALHDIQRGWATGWWLLLGVIAKVAWENIYGASEQTATLINATVAVESHLLGVVAALALVGLPMWLSALLSKQRSKPTQQ
ncbi:rhombosortase [uncultured Ferrimonas sp.]|uniref:rhombosortase n=1 Tax=uncultured Ferrimonas sp. TaxID=432640 RepID=UPI002627B6ED|nr:rhombosortase [uncultured Ferrimonas sp.]